MVSVSVMFQQWLTRQLIGPCTVLTLFVMPTLPARCYADTSSARASELSTICERMTRWHESIVSLEVRVQSSHIAGTSLPVWTVTSAKGNKRRCEVFHEPFNCPGLDPLSLTRILDDNRLYMYAPFTRRLEVTANFADEYAWKAQRTVYFEAMGWWGGDVDQIPVDARVWFIPSLFSDSRISVRECDAEVAVLQIGDVMSISVDMRHGVILRRECFGHNSSTRRGEPAFTLQFDDFRYVDGVLLPFRLERQSSDRRFHTRHNVESWLVNKVEDARFAVPDRPGTLVIDRDNDARSVRPGGLEVLNRILDHAARERVESEKVNRRVLSIEVVVSIAVLGFVLRLVCSRH